jgi:hypothetical protein
MTLGVFFSDLSHNRVRDDIASPIDEAEVFFVKESL